MNIVETVEIKGFWGNRTVTISFEADANFLIGVNGSGKTTAINLLAATLQADFGTLDRLQFSSVTVTLREVGGKRRKPSIKVTKRQSRESPYTTVTYEIKDQATARAKKYSLNEVENQRMLRSMYQSERYTSPRAFRRQIARGLMEHLHGLVNVNWLSIHRSTFNRMFAADDESYESTIDKKLKDLSDGFVRFFSTIASQKNDLLAQFQQTVFLSLIELPRDSHLRTDVDLDNLTKALRSIYGQFGVDTAKTKRRLDKYTSALQKGLDAMKTPEKAPDWNDFTAILTAPRVSTVVNEWWELQDRQATVEKSKTKFLKLLNEMLLHKNFEISPQNELVAITDSGKRLTTKQLSSGEKQLLIILGDALLTQGSPSVYIADEPELSLHVDWQERLIATLREINSRAQVIVATHSPDIVGSFKNRTINMADIIK